VQTSLGGEGGPSFEGASEANGAGRCRWTFGRALLAEFGGDSHGFVEDREAVSPSDAASLTMLHSEVEDVLDTLTPRERRVLQLRFGPIDGHQRALEEVGKRFGVTCERIP